EWSFLTPFSARPPACGCGPDPLAKRGVGRGEAKLMGVVRAQGAKRLSLGPVHFGVTARK
ncbi:hypothetical protein, partial [Sphingopyxis flava]|uniref:hypothetical protein n=1 Tax=Sphingopyxis flava TaxID=1507287 RepID=UPI001C378999